jgi:hypothetical protein
VIFTIPKSLRGKCRLFVNDVEYELPAEVASIEVLPATSGSSGGRTSSSADRMVYTKMET